MLRDFIVSRHDLHIPEKNALKILIRMKIRSLMLPILKLYLYLANLTFQNLTRSRLNKNTSLTKYHFRFMFS